MGQFFKFVFASMLGVILASLLFFLVLAGLFTAVVALAGKKDEVKIERASILKISLNEEVSDRSVQYFDSEKYKIKERLGLSDILKDIHNAKGDINISGIFLDLSVVNVGFASLEEIRNAMLDFKKSGKFIDTYSETLSQKSYYLASVSDKIYLNPQGIIEFDGLSSEYTFFKGALDKLEIEPQIFRVGKFKSFVEPFTLTKMSDANREQIQSYLGSIFTHFLSKISDQRKIGIDSLRMISDQLKIQTADDALKYHLVDGLEYRDEVLEQMRKHTKKASIKELKFVSLSNYDGTVSDSLAGENNRIALIYANGDISGGEGDEKSIGSEGLSRVIRNARLNDKIKAIVIRVNSPGGSSLASDVIWREVTLAKKVKPVIVSMGDVAASGGYYISCAADKIVAEPNTITGSIGIFAIIPNASKFFNDKLGITFDRVTTGQHSDMLTISRPLSPFEKDVIQNEVNKGYKDFITKVALGRKKPVAYIDSIGQGRVWTGEQALKIGLVDQIGSFDDAVQAAAKMAGLKTYSTESLPSQKGFIESLFSDVDEHVQSFFIKKELGENYRYLNSLNEMRKVTGLQARLPFDLNIN